MRTMLSKMLEMLRTHGLSAVVARGFLKARRELLAWQRALQEEQRWRNQITRDVPSLPVGFFALSHPEISIVLVAANKTGTVNTLHAIAREPGIEACEIIVVVDPNEPTVRDFIGQCSGITIVEQAGSYAERGNAGASEANGTAIVFVGSAIVPLIGWLDALLAAYASDPMVAIVGGQLQTRDRKIAHAGGIVWSDGRAGDVGLGRSRFCHEFLYTRETDYVNPAFMLVRTEDFTRVGGFDPAFTTPTYASLMLASTLRRAGHRILSVPTAIAFDGSVTSLKSESDREKCVQKMAELSLDAAPRELQEGLALRRHQGKKRLLMVDSHVPFLDRDAGSRRIAAIARILRTLRYDVLFLPDDGIAYEPSASQLRADGIDVLEHPSGGLATFAEIPFSIDIAWISRPELYERYAHALAGPAISVRLYDTVDLHFLRERGEAEISGRELAWEKTRERELACARDADRTIVCSGAERDVLASFGIESIIVPVIESTRQSSPPAFSERQGALFVGNFTHQPNVDAAVYLCETILPILLRDDPDFHVIIAGYEPPQSVMQLRSPHVRITGYVSDLTPLFDAARVFLAPLRFGAGVKGKIVQSLSLGLPAVTTSIGVEGTEFVHGDDIIVADNPAAFVAETLRLYRDESAWNRQAARGIASASRFAPERVRDLVTRAVESGI